MHILFILFINKTTNATFSFCACAIRLEMKIEKKELRKYRT